MARILAQDTDDRETIPGQSLGTDPRTDGQDNHIHLSAWLVRSIQAMARFLTSNDVHESRARAFIRCSRGTYGEEPSREEIAVTGPMDTTVGSRGTNGVAEGCYHGHAAHRLSGIWLPSKLRGGSRSGSPW